jgi:sugar/nucleoside kinase (ribokinase family)
MPPRLLGFGSALLDELAHVPEEFLAGVPGMKGGTELVERAAGEALLKRLPCKPVQAPGGSAANTIVGAARLGLKCGMLAKVGADAAGDFYRAAMCEAGIDIAPFKLSATEPTGCCLSLITPDSQRTMRTFLGAAATLSPDEITPADFAGYTHLHTEGYQLFSRELMLRVLSLAKAAGLEISLDLSAPEVVNATKSFLPELLREYVTTVFANEDEASAFAGGKGEEAGLEALSKIVPVTCVKLGVRGAIIRSGGKNVRVSAHVVKAVDTTGAGDLWAAGYLYGRLTGAGFATAGDFGARTSSAVVQVTGAVIPESEWTRLRRECR